MTSSELGIVVGLASTRTNAAAVARAISMGATWVEFAPHYAGGKAVEVAVEALAASGGHVDFALKASPELLTSNSSVLDQIVRKCRSEFGNRQPQLLLLHNPERLGGRDGDWLPWIAALGRWGDELSCDVGIATWSLLKDVSPLEVEADFAACGVRLSVLESACSLVNVDAIRQRRKSGASSGYEYWASGIFDGGWLPQALGEGTIPQDLGRDDATDLCIAMTLLSSPQRVVIAATSVETTQSVIERVRRSEPFSVEALESVLRLVE